MRLSITADDIARGRPTDGLRDALALALRRATGRDWYAGIRFCMPLTEEDLQSDGAIVWACRQAREGRRYAVWYPWPLQRWLAHYRRHMGARSEPAAFDLHIETESLLPCPAA